MGDDPRRLALAGQPVARLPRDVAEQHVDLEVLLERLPFEEGGLERVPQRADGIGEDVVKHLSVRLLPGDDRLGRMRATRVPRERRSLLAWTLPET